MARLLSTLQLVFASLAFQTVAHVTDDPAWSSFKAEFEKDYVDADEEATRYAIYKKTVAQIEAHNSQQHSFKLKLTKFADFTRQEFLKTLNEPVQEGPEGKKFHEPFLPEERATNDEGATGLPNEIDWVKSGALTPVKSQGHCEVCWAFAGVAMLESAQQIRLGAVGGAPISLSEQQAIDCAGNGCDSGGWYYNFLDHVVGSTKEVCTEAEYPFQNIKGYKHACQEGSKKCDHGLDMGSITGKNFVKSEADLQSAVYQQPTRICINASSFPSAAEDDQLMFALYSGGIIDVPCHGHLNHAVVVVGYGTENGVDYWKVRNSWGSGWGEKGYFRLKRNMGGKGAMCLMDVNPVYPVLKGAEACPDSYSTAWNYGCQSFCECHNADGSQRNHCGQCCKVVGSTCKKTSPTNCAFGYSKEWNYGCQSACACNNADGSHKTMCDKCCHISPDGVCWSSGTLNDNLTETTATATPEPVVI